MKKIFFLFLYLFALNVSIFANEQLEEDSLFYDSKPKFGIYSSFNLILNQANFSELPNIRTCCPEYTTTFGNGFSIGGLIEYPIEPNIRLGLRLGFDNYFVNFVSKELKPVFDGNKSIQAQIDFNLKSYLGFIGIEPMFMYSFYENLWTNFNLRLGYNLYSDHEQREEIIKPENQGTFNDGKRLHYLSWGEIEDINKIELGIRLGASYEFIFMKDSSLTLAPEINFGINFLPVVKNLSWYAHSIKLGVALKYTQPPPPPPPPLPPIPPPYPNLILPESPPSLSSDVALYQIDSTGKKTDNFHIEIEDFVSLNLRPLLNYIFFDYNTSEIPNKYKLLKFNEVDNFSKRDLQNLDALQTYYNVLNIIGMRLKENPTAKIELIGCNSNLDAEVNNLELSQNRANAVRDYLIDIWKIDYERISVKSRNLPTKPSISQDFDNSDENRRVEIYSNNDEIFAPVTTIDTMRSIQNYNMQFENHWTSDVGIRKWNLVAEYDNKPIFEVNKPNSPDSIVKWNLSQENSILNRSGNIFYYLKVEDKLNQSATSPKYRLPIEQLTIDKKRLERIADKEFEYYSLILFDFGKADLRKEHQSVVNLIKNRVYSDSKVYINGYTDLTGDEEDNRKLSEKRAKTVAKRLKISDEYVKGIGESKLLYPNDTPEGRFYCRTVQIIIETPVSE